MPSTDMSWSLEHRCGRKQTLNKVQGFTKQDKDPCIGNSTCHDDIASRREVSLRTTLPNFHRSCCPKNHFVLWKEEKLPPSFGFSLEGQALSGSDIAELIGPCYFIECHSSFSTCTFFCRLVDLVVFLRSCSLVSSLKECRTLDEIVKNIQMGMR